MLKYKADCEKGDIIKWCDMEYTVIENTGYRGKVAEGVYDDISEIPSDEILPFDWEFEGERAKLIKKGDK